MLDLNNSNNKSLLQNAKLSAKQKLSVLAHTIHSYYTPEGCSLSTHCHHNNNNNKSICKAQNLVHRDYSKRINQTVLHHLSTVHLVDGNVPICYHIQHCLSAVHLSFTWWFFPDGNVPICYHVQHCLSAVPLSFTWWFFPDGYVPICYHVQHCLSAVPLSVTWWFFFDRNVPICYHVQHCLSAVPLSFTWWFFFDGNVPICYHVQHCLSAVPLSFTWWFFFDSSILLKWSEASASWTRLCRASEAWRKMKTKRITRNNKTKQKI